MSANIGLIDSDLLDNGTRFPNLALMKISGYFKEQGNNVKLTTWNEIGNYDYALIAKVFTKTYIPDSITGQGQQLLFDPYPDTEFIFGGTGFDFDKNNFLPDEIEHHMPDYNLYNDYVNEQLSNGDKRTKWKYYLDYSIGYTTRFCFRQCEFCVNRDKKKVVKTSATIETGLWLVSVDSGNIYSEQKFYYENHTIKDVIDWIKMNFSSIEVEYVI